MARRVGCAPIVWIAPELRPSFTVRFGSVQRAKEFLQSWGDFSELNVKPIRMGLSGALVTKILATDRSGRHRILVSKFDVRSRIRREVSRVEHFIQGIILHAPEVRDRGYDPQSGQACVTYAFAGDVTLSQKIGSLWLQEEYDEAARLLRSVLKLLETLHWELRETLSQQQCRAKKVKNPFALDPSRIAHFNALHETRGIKLRATPGLLRRLEIRSPAGVIIGHNDLHCGNVILDEIGSPWFIDFYEAGLGYVLCDFAFLEADLLFKVLSPTADHRAAVLRHQRLLRSALAFRSTDEFLLDMLSVPTISAPKDSLWAAAQLLRAIRKDAHRMMFRESIEDYRALLLRKAVAYAERDDAEMTMTQRWLAAEAAKILEGTWNNQRARI